jgi:hypothetical protein
MIFLIQKIKSFINSNMLTYDFPIQIFIHWVIKQNKVSKKSYSKEREVCKVDQIK